MIANYQNIDTSLIDVNEKIKQNNLRKFIYTSLTLEDIDYSESNIFVSYLYKTNKYQVFIFDKRFTFLEIDIFQCFYKSESKTIDLFLSDNYFVIYINQHFYYYQKINYEINDDDLFKYIEKNLELKIDNIHRLSFDDLEELKAEYIKSNISTSLIDISESNNKSFKIFIFFILLLVILFAIYLYYFIENNEALILSKKEQNQNSLMEYKNSHKYNYFDEDIKTILLNLSKNKLKLESFKYKNDELKLSFISKNRIDIYSFLDLYKNKLKENSIDYLKEKKVYICNANIKTFRK